MTASLSVTPSTAAPGTTVDVDGAGFDPKAKFALETVNANGDAVGQSSNINRPRRDGTFRVGINVPPLVGPAKVRAYQRSALVAEAPVTVAIAAPPPDPTPGPTPVPGMFLRGWGSRAPDGTILKVMTKGTDAELQDAARIAGARITFDGPTLVDHGVLRIAEGVTIDGGPHGMTLRGKTLWPKGGRLLRLRLDYSGGEAVAQDTVTYKEGVHDFLLSQCDIIPSAPPDEWLDASRDCHDGTIEFCRIRYNPTRNGRGYISLLSNGTYRITFANNLIEGANRIPQGGWWDDFASDGKPETPMPPSLGLTALSVGNVITLLRNPANENAYGLVCQQGSIMASIDNTYVGSGTPEYVTSAKLYSAGSTFNGASISPGNLATLPAIEPYGIPYLGLTPGQRAAREAATRQFAGCPT